MADNLTMAQKRKYMRAVRSINQVESLGWKAFHNKGVRFRKKCKKKTLVNQTTQKK